MDLRKIFFHLGAFLLAALGTFSAQAQSDRIIKVSPDNQEITIPLTQADQGRDIVLLTESGKASAQALTLSLGGADGVAATLSSAIVGADVAAESLDSNVAFQQLTIRDTQGIIIPKIEVGASGSGGVTCLQQHPDVVPMLPIFRPIYPGKSDSQICEVFYPPQDNPGPQMTSGFGIIMRDACAVTQKIVAQVRISTAGLRASDFDGTKSLIAKVLLAFEERGSNYIRTKVAEGRERGASYYMATTLHPVYSNEYGTPDSDQLLIQRYDRLGVLKGSDSFQTRPFFTYKIDRGYTIAQMNIANISSYIRRRNIRRSPDRESFTTVNYKDGKVFSYCMPRKPKIIGYCTPGYSSAFKISCPRL